MDQIGNIIVYIIMICAVAGAIAAIVKEESGLGKEFLQGVYSIGPIFVPVAGIMAAIPYLTVFIENYIGPLFTGIGADAALAPSLILPVDMGTYVLADVLAQNRESWIMAMFAGCMAGPAIGFNIPVGLAMLDKKDHKYLALGVMAGILTAPVGIFISSAIVSLTDPVVREIISTNAAATYQLALGFGQIMINLVPLIIFCGLLALGLKIFPNKMIKGFMIFGKFLDTCLKLILVFSIVEYFTGVFTAVLGSWGFDPIIADAADQYRALEVAGYVGIMLAGAFPMVYLIKTYLSKPLEVVGRKCGFSSVGSAGIMAGSANILAMYRLISEMPAADKVKCIAFSMTGAFIFGDHLAYSANFQPTLILPLMIGKILAGILAIVLARWLSVPRAIELEKEDLAMVDQIKSDETSEPPQPDDLAV